MTLAVRRRAVLLAAGAAAASVVLTSCTSTPSTSSTTTTSRGETQAASSTTTTSRPTSSTSSTSSTVATLGTCAPTQLRFATQTGNGAAGTISLVITMTNTSTSSCTLAGYPGMQLLDAHGNALPTNVARGGVAVTPSSPARNPPGRVTLAPGKAAGFALSYSDVLSGTETICPTSASVEVTPPNDTAHGVLPLRISPCAGGTVHVSPVYALA